MLLDPFWPWLQCDGEFAPPGSDPESWVSTWQIGKGSNRSIIYLAASDASDKGLQSHRLFQTPLRPLKTLLWAPANVSVATDTALVISLAAPKRAGGKSAAYLSLHTCVPVMSCYQWHLQTSDKPTCCWLNFLEGFWKENDRKQYVYVWRDGAHISQFHSYCVNQTPIGVLCL